MEMKYVVPDMAQSFGTLEFAGESEPVFERDKNNRRVLARRNILLVIEDNGCGIKASDLSRVFEKGFTGSNRNKANATGMGLYLSKKLCDVALIFVSLMMSWQKP